MVTSAELRGFGDIGIPTVKVGFSMGTEVKVSDKEVEEASAPSSMSSAALTEPKRAAEV